MTFVILSVLMLDQYVKIMIKTNMYYHESIHITDWFYIHFIENNGMAFGMQIMPKAIQTVLRIIFASALTWYAIMLAKASFRRGYIIGISLIVAGAWGNIVDSVFYGAIFSESTFSKISTFVPNGNGYSDWLHGKVVDMFYFPILEFDWFNWIPFIGGDHFVFFAPVFNIADASISCGVLLLVLFYRKDLDKSVTILNKMIACITRLLPRH